MSFKTFFFNSILILFTTTKNSLIDLEINKKNTKNKLEILLEKSKTSLDLYEKFHEKYFSVKQLSSNEINHDSLRENLNKILEIKNLLPEVIKIYRDKKKQTAFLIQYNLEQFNNDGEYESKKNKYEFIEDVNLIIKSNIFEENTKNLEEIIENIENNMIIKITDEKNKIKISGNKKIISIPINFSKNINFKPNIKNIDKTFSDKLKKIFS